MAIYKETDKQQQLVRIWKNQNIHMVLVRMYNGATTWETVWKSHKILRQDPQNMTGVILRHILNRNENIFTQKDVHQFLSALFITAKNENNPNVHQ